MGVVVLLVPKSHRLEITALDTSSPSNICNCIRNISTWRYNTGTSLHSLTGTDVSQVIPVIYICKEAAMDEEHLS